MIEILLIIGILIVSFYLLRKNFFSGLVLALVLSTFLHKELFSIYIWDMLPIRIFMGAFLLNSVYEFYLFNKFSTKFVKYLKDPFILLNIFVVFSKLISIINSLNLSASINLNIFTITASVFLITIYIKLGYQEILNLFEKYIVIGVILSLVTLVQLFLYFKYSFLFGAILNIAGSSVDFPAFSLSKDFFNNSLRIVVMTRVGSLFWDVNHFGGFLAGLVVPLLALLFQKNTEGRKSKNWNLFYFFVLNLGLFLTNSRSAWILAAVGYLIFMIFAVYRKIGKKGIAFTLLGITIFSTFLLFLYQDKNSYFREKVKSYFHYRLDSFDSHFLLLQGTIEVFNQNPFIGGGAGSFFEHFKTTPISNEFLRRDPAGLSVRVPAHSVWGESLAETGVVGTSVFVLFVLFILGNLFYAVIHSQDADDYFLASSFIGTTFGWLISGIFYSFNSEFFYILFFFPVIYVIKRNKIKLEEVLLYFKAKSFYSLLILFAISFYMIFINLGTNKFIPFDEAIYAKVAKNMFETGDYFSLTWLSHENNWFEKPSLFFVLASMSYSLFGVGEFAARFATAVFSIICLIYTYRIGKKVKDSVTGYFAVLAMVLNVSYLYYSRTAMLDVMLTALTTASVFYFLQSLGSRKNLNLVLSGLFIGLAVMVKSIVGFLPLVIFFIFYVIQLFIKKFAFKEMVINMLVLTLVSLLVSAPWHIYMYLVWGYEFINTYFGYHLFRRYTTTIEDKGGPWYFYFTVIRNSMRIWFLILIPALILFVYKFIKEKLSSEKLIILIASLFVLVFFSTSSSKLKWYVMPIYPFLAVICGFLISEVKEFIFKKTKSLQLTFIATFLFIIVNFYYFYSVRDMVYTGDLTGRLVTLIQVNNLEKDLKYSYFDKIDNPLAVYYSEKDFDIVDYSKLKEKLMDFKNTPHSETLKTTFITSQSRYKSLKEVFPELSIDAENKDFVLGSLTIK